MSALPALSGRVVIAAPERAGFAVIRTRGPHCILRHRTMPAARRSCLFIGKISRPEPSGKTAKPASAGLSFSTLFKQLPRRLVEGGTEVVGRFLRGGRHPLPNPPPSRGRAPRRRAMFDSGTKSGARRGPKIFSISPLSDRRASCCCYEGCSAGEALPLDGGGFGWG